MPLEQTPVQTAPEEPTKQGFPILITIALAIVVFFAASMVIRGRGGGGGVPLIISANHYNEVLEQVEKETVDVLAKAEEEVPLTKDEVKILDGVEPRVLGLINFDPSRFNIYLLAAKIAFANQKYDAAVDACTRLYELGPAKGSPDVVMVVAETRYVCSRSNFHLRKFNESIAEAREAVKIMPQDPRYHWALATAYAETGQKEEALEVIDESVKIGATSTKLLALERFLRKPLEASKDTK